MSASEAALTDCVGEATSTRGCAKGGGSEFKGLKGLAVGAATEGEVEALAKLGIRA